MEPAHSTTSGFQSRVRMAKVFTSLQRFAPFFLKKTTDHKDVDSRRLVIEYVVFFLGLELNLDCSRCSLSCLNVKSAWIEVRRTDTTKPASVRQSRTIESPNENSQGQSLRYPGTAALPNER
jgi:hypothetical protein